MKHILLVFFILVPLAASAQDDWSWQQALLQLTDVEDAESLSWEETCEMLDALEAQPLDINATTREQLEEELKDPSSGFVSLKDNALKLVEEGVTTGDEVLRVIYEDI